MHFFSSKHSKKSSSTIELNIQHPLLGNTLSMPYTQYMAANYGKLTQYKCYFYLSLLARFVTITKDMTEEEMKLYLVRAEYRYFKFINLWQDSYHIPAIDVAIFMQAHKAHPLQFEDDCKRDSSGYMKIRTNIDLGKIHEDSENKHNSYWAHNMGVQEPYHVSKENLMESSQASFAEITCIVCLVNIEVKWKDFTEWRTDHKVALQCHRCNVIFTMAHVGKANLLIDLRNSMECRYPGDISTVIGKQHVKIIKYIKSINDIQTLPFNSGLDALKEYLYNNQREAGLDNDGSIEEFIELAKKTYFCTPYIQSSIDLLTAVAEQYEFLHKITQTLKWSALDYNKMILHYKHYLELSQVTSENPNIILIPDYKADIARHVHMFEVGVERLTPSLMKKALDHNNRIPQGEEHKYANITKGEWNLLRAQRMQNKITYSFSKVVEVLIKEKRFGGPSMCTPDTFIITDSVQKYDKYNVNEASYYKKDGFKNFDNLKFVMNYMTQRSIQLKCIAFDWSASNCSKVLQTSGEVPKLTEGKTIKLPYYPFTTEDLNFNWPDANKAWSKTFKDVKNYIKIKTRLIENRSIIGSKLINFEITFNAEIAFKKREMEARNAKIEEERRRRQILQKRRYGGGGSNGGNNSSGGGGYSYDGGSYYSGGYDGGYDGGYSGDSGGCSSGGGDGGGGGGGGGDCGGGGW